MEEIPLSDEGIRLMKGAVPYDQEHYIRTGMPDVWEARERLIEFYSGKKGFDIGGTIHKIMHGEIPAELIDPLKAHYLEDHFRLMDSFPVELYKALETRFKFGWVLQ